MSIMVEVQTSKQTGYTEDSKGIVQSQILLLPPKHRQATVEATWLMKLRNTF